jgi:hypothetical protein
MKADAATISEKATNFMESVRKYWIEILAISFWYIALFPGRLGFDYSEMIRIIKRGESTNWWTGEFFWLVKLTSFNGRTIALSSAICTLVLAYASWSFVSALIRDEQIRRRVRIFYFASPIFGGFAVNVTHDVFLAAGILLIVSQRLALDKFKDINLRLELFIGFLLLTSQLGRIILLVNLVYLLFLKSRKKIGFLIFALLSTSMLSNLTVTQFPITSVIYPLIFDLKCIAQHPEARINQSEWEYLESLAPVSEWKVETSCTFGDEQLSVMPNFKGRLEVDLMTNYFSIVAKNPAIAVLGHIQRSRGALPPPFFPGPTNQVYLDPEIPIGFDTNIALQSGTELLHPSIDEPSVNSRLSFLKPLELIAQFPIFLVNQASWFWGWGALWLYPLIAYLLVYTREKGLFFKLLPIFILHFSLVIITPGPFGRYVMASIIAGLIASFGIIFQLLAKRNYSEGQGVEA